jgi:hypothetical protein
MNDLVGYVPPTRRGRAEAKKADVAQAKADWQAFPKLAGTHLSIRRSSRGVWELVTSSNSVGATSRGGYFTRPASTINARGRTYRWQRSESRRAALRELAATRTPSERSVVDATTGLPTLTMTGRHFNFKAGTKVMWADGTTVTLPARGRKAGNAVMSAIDESGTVLIHYRLLSQKRNILFGHRNVEVAVSPEARSASGIALLAAVTADGLLNYVQTPGGGG